MPPSTTQKFPKSQRAADPKLARQLTHERISADLEAFRRNGGQIEKLGNTRVLKRLA
ncbi:hypothetical protein [Pseudoxanthomonas composti]|uniref:hypothetical protein n=1 Tax=Pseudoxanthomonas composti TaxID=2137479 RepID=UPI0013E91EBE|nr:hypothetical protein [Pseudoxanthomonas composti]